MKKAIEKPNLPSNTVEMCAIGARYSNIAELLADRGINMLGLAMDKRLSYTVCHHADMLVCHMGGDTVICGSEENRDRIAAIGLEGLLSERIPQPKYPSDVHLNQLILGDFAIGRRDVCDPLILEILSEKGIDYADIQQGYARCSAAVVAEKALITSDYSVAKAAVRAGVNVLIIRPGFIELPDYEYGFIGGTCGLIAPDRMAFTGDITRHPDGDAIIAFLKKYDVTADCLNDDTLMDIGGILPLTEY